MKKLLYLCTILGTFVASPAFAQDENSLIVPDDDIVAFSGDAVFNDSPVQDEALANDTAQTETFYGNHGYPAAEDYRYVGSANSEVAQYNERPSDMMFNGIPAQPPVLEWKYGMGFYLGIGPAFDLRDPAAGYSARIGLDLHGKYFGGGLEVNWNMLWVTNGAKRSDHRDAAYRATNSGLLLMLKGFIPATNQIIVTLGVGAGLGKRYEIIFSDKSYKEEDSSWLAKAQVGALWLFESHCTLGLGLELNFGNYLFSEDHRWSDDETDISLGLVLTFSYQYMSDF